MADKAGMGDVIVVAVSEEQLHEKAGITRYILALSGYQEPITLIGKHTNIVEAQFYRHVAAEVPFLAPHCWFTHISGDHGWIVIDEVYNDWSPARWTDNDVEGIVEKLARLHAGSWEKTAFLESLGWRSLLAGSESDESEGRLNGGSGFEPAHWPLFHQSASPPKSRMRDLLSLLSDHAVRSAGRLAPTLASAAEGLEALKTEGGWPGVLEEQHIQAMADLLDDPVPMLHPLRQLPETLVHGNPSTRHWHLNMFGQYRLLDWQTVLIGPGIYDLVSFIEQFGLIEQKNGIVHQRDGWPSTIETIEDSYLLTMGSKLGIHYNALANRQAIPAARCLHVIVTWLPRFAEWLWNAPDERYNWMRLGYLGSNNSTATELSSIVTLRQHLSGVFARFLQAYRAL